MIKGVVVEEKLVKGDRDEEEAKGLEKREKYIEMNSKINFDELHRITFIIGICGVYGKTSITARSFHLHHLPSIRQISYAYAYAYAYAYHFLLSSTLVFFSSLLI
jgi:hypothetical protein